MAVWLSLSATTKGEHMKQLELEYPAYNYTETSKSAWINKKDKLTKREQVYEFIKTQSSTKQPKLKERQGKGKSNSENPDEDG